MDPRFTHSSHTCPVIQPKHHMGILQRLMLGYKIPVWIKKGSDTYLNSFADYQGYIISAVSQKGVIENVIVVLPIMNNLPKHFPPSYLKLARNKDGKPMTREEFIQEKNRLKSRVLTAIDQSESKPVERDEEEGEIDYGDEPSSSPSGSRSRSRSRSRSHSPRAKRSRSPVRMSSSMIFDESRFTALGRREKPQSRPTKKQRTKSASRSRAPAVSRSMPVKKKLVNELTLLNLKKLVKDGIFRNTPYSHFTVEEVGSSGQTRTQRRGYIAGGGAKQPIEVNERTADLVRRALVSAFPKRFAIDYSYPIMRA